MIRTFAPTQTDTALLACSTTSARVPLDPYSATVRVVNDGASTAFILFGESNIIATTSKMPIKAGATETFTKGIAGYVAGICASGTTTLYITAGEGL